MTEAWGGGVASAIASYVRATPDAEHHAVIAVRDGDYVDDGELGRFATVDARRGQVALLRGVRDAVARIRPDAIHAHSSYGGLLARVVRPHGARVVYTPHCYAFERADLSRGARAAIRAVERLLSVRTDVVAACSPREAALTRSLNHRVRVVHVPNVADAPLSPPTRPDGPVETVVAVGRLSRQKDPAVFATMARAHRDGPGRNLPFVWVGGGETDCRALEDAGVRITGWVPQSQVARELGGTSVYVHTARWEGFPMAVLEAARSGVPVLARRAAPFDHCPQRWVFDTEDAFLTMLASLDSPAVRAENVREWRLALAENTAPVQRERLLSCYTGKDES
ncbi:glycosyltransferase [Litorihabitans aurantiacus]|uniref:D-inositol 3-phosphate glycosyltransferase n=1 Tax=Litorihabitans aurantiacus TaxID=1930061 RepID=A0AA37XCZ2_9MICO|nr:glycosyltransferase [Litorihabitans aurantiacus]GMA30388.1 glycosyl transferase [Litorihabitans aurantiacus]